MIVVISFAISVCVQQMSTVSEEEGADDGVIDDVFEQSFSPSEHHEEASSCSPSSVPHLRYRRMRVSIVSSLLLEIII